MRQEEEKGVGMGQEGTLGAREAAQSPSADGEKTAGEEGIFFPSPGNPDPTRDLGAQSKEAPSSDTLVGSNPCYLPHRAF